MMINHQFNMFFPGYLSDNIYNCACGWKEAVDLAGGDLYMHCLEPQKIPKK